MKKITFVFILLIASYFCNAQESAKVAMVKVVQSWGIGGMKPVVNIIYADNTVETIELENERKVSEPAANEKKIREALDKVLSKGYSLKTSTQCPFGGDNIFLFTTYIFEKK